MILENKAMPISSRFDISANTRTVPAINLICAIYEQAAKDWTQAMAVGDVHDVQQIEKFLLSGDYGYEHGEYLLNTLKSEYTTAMNVIQDFITGADRSTTITPTQVAIPILKIIISSAYRKKLTCKLEDDHNQIYTLKYKKGVYPNGKKEKMV